jgi:nucleoside-diphosphate-sugar epimerase
LNSLYGQLSNILNVEIEPVYDPPRPGDVKHSQASIRAIEKDLGYRTSVPFDEGLRRTVRWYQEASKSV